MKKTLLTFGLLAATHGTFAQSFFAPELGIQAAQISSLHADADKSSRVGLRAGGNFQLELAKHFAISTGLFYSSMGVKGTSESIDGLGKPHTGTSTINLDYLQVPVLVHYISGKADDYRFFAGAGPYLAYLFSASAKINNSSLRYKLPIGHSENDLFLPLDAGFCVDAGVQFPNKLYLRAYYNQGLKDIFSNNTGSSVTNLAFGLSLGYRIHFKTAEKHAQ
jgi:hypothetical protein